MPSLSLIERALLFYGAALPDHPGKWRIHDALRRLLRVKPDQDCEVVRQGLRWVLNPADFEHAGLFWTGQKDRWDIEILRRLVAPGAVIFDVGANIGYYSLMLAPRLQGRGQIHAFEPHPRTFSRLVHHIQINGLDGIIIPHQIALSGATGTGTLVERSDNSGASRLGEDAPGVSVPVMTLDDFCRSRGISRLDLMKIDVEGLEERVLRAGGETLERLRPTMLVEFWTTGMARAGSSPAALGALLEERGYRLFQARRERITDLLVLPDSEIPENVLCVPRERADSFRKMA